MLKTLSRNTLSALPDGVRLPSYDLSVISTGIVHLGPGAFHRAHQAAFIDDVLAQEQEWALCEVSLNRSDVWEKLNNQNFLYTLVTLDRDICYRIIGSLKDILVAPRQPGHVLDRLSAPTTRIVTLTITENGYCLNTEGRLDSEHPGIRRDLEAPRTPTTAIGYITESLKRRHEAGIAPFTVISCDNMMANGKLLARAVRDYAAIISPDLEKWIEDEVCFPNTMVDCITPQTDPSLCARVSGALGLMDAWPIQREAFAQWVLEDRFSLGRPDWESVGVTMTGNVEIYEKAKLRLLNGAHSALAYLGLLAGCDTVYDFVNEESFNRFIREMMATEILPTLESTAGFDLKAYMESLLKRFGNPIIKHHLMQISRDGSLKLPIRTLSVIRDNLDAGRPIARLSLVIAAWMHVLRRSALDDAPIVDPLDDLLLVTGKRCAEGGAHAVDLFLALREVFPAALAGNQIFKTALKKAYHSLRSGEKSDVIRALVHVQNF